MWRKAVFLPIFLWNWVVLQSQNLPDFKVIFEDEYAEAETYFNENSVTINYLCEKFGADKKLSCAIVFPERVRYSAIRNYAENLSLEVLYVEYGSAIDFSVGPFQMKPSFAEKVEKIIAVNSLLSAKYAALLPVEISETDIRQKRIERLGKLSTQLLYLFAFQEITAARFNLTDLSKIELVRFFASAYNFSFEATKAEILRAQNFSFFPYGSAYLGEQYRYVEVAEYYYRRL